MLLSSDLLNCLFTYLMSIEKSVNILHYQNIYFVIFSRRDYNNCRVHFHLPVEIKFEIQEEEEGGGLNV
jgi:hypothetical protein